jgi:rSAM/selenodomain-associated transferase 1
MTVVHRLPGGTSRSEVLAMNLLVVAKTPEPGRVKTRLCPPCTPEQAARVAAAALADTVDAVTAAPAEHRTLVVEGPHPAPPGWHRVAQHGAGLGARLAHAFTDTRRAGTPSLLVGMDTPQLTAARLTGAADLLGTADAVLGLAEDGGWWALGLTEPRHAAVLREIPTSQPTTGARTLAALRRRGLRVATLPVLRDVDTAADAHAVAALCPPGSRFATAVSRDVPRGAGS